GINLDFYSLNELSVSNIGFNARVFNKKANKVSIGVKINNIFNEAYYSQIYVQCQVGILI
ncbi:hypothetical protein, partial [Tenacibaculum maritimum]|uniref:hypothetical protein n=1 Tax=Tenacibaculum maritimum TaxID=107401 RepID=UPI0038772E92